jgi:hypothetical protein
VKRLFCLGTLVLVMVSAAGCSAGAAASPTPAEGYWCWSPPVMPGPHKLENRKPGPREELCSQYAVDLYVHDKPPPATAGEAAPTPWPVASGWWCWGNDVPGVKSVALRYPHR